MEKWRVREMKGYRRMCVKQIVPQKLWCDPEKEFPLETKHQFDAVKVYLLTDGEGHESGLVICPTHNIPMPIEIVRRRLQQGDGKTS